jgi:rod shape-determining protein MreC
LLVTSGLGGRFPPGYPVALVEKVERNPGQSFAEVSARPTARLEQSREVLLVRALPAAQEAAACDRDQGPCPAATAQPPATTGKGQ